ncbi:hypothetical protein [Arthrobacter sp. CP30]
MSTPRNPGPTLPEKPAGPPRIVQESPAPELPSDTASVLERLKAAQPRVVPATSDDSAAPRSAGSDPAKGTSATTGAGTPESTRSGSGTASVAATDAGFARTDRTAATADGADKDDKADKGKARIPADTSATDGTPSTAAGERRRVAAEAARTAAVRARRAAGVTGRTIGRSGVATGKAISQGSATAGKAIGRGSTATIRHIGAWDADVVRQAAVTLCAIACILGSAAGVGAFGGPSIRDAAGGLFSPDATLLAPSSSAFSIWSVIYAGLVAYTVFQWFPSQRRTGRQRRLGWTVAASMLLNLAWILSAQAGGLTVSLVVIMLLFFTLLAAVRTLNSHPTQTRVEGALVDAPIGLYLGWVLLAAGANAAAFFTAGRFDLFEWQGTTWAIVGIAAILLTAAVICSTDRGRLSVAAATSWGLLWIAVERALAEPPSLAVALAAALAIFLLLITAGSRRHRVDHAYRRWLRAEEDALRDPIDLLGDDDYEDSRS